MLGIFTKLFHMLEALCCQLDLELASLTTDFDASNFSKYSEALQILPSLQAELEEAPVVTAKTAANGNLYGINE